MGGSGPRCARALAGLVGVLLVAGCSHGTGRASATTSPTAGPFPTALLGVWHAAYQGQDQKLAFTRGGYEAYVDPSDKAVGTAAVEGSLLTVSGSSLCPGVGRYRWRVDGDALRLTEVGTDPCPRADFFPGTPWRRLGRP